ncbi:efflux RND transporter permease subunit [Phycisphaera mikurensis]|uniref:Putative efflux system inner membrane protein n=1 Tax=Phycisphaera mikurensis (strain NBRC 102666 / KCTC 22515 / FYK2301M01) TaxID=1142394 RepID=I0IIZ2_PHYMF|nr:efflux RND transporter permease subunit [Phycisphaera mikurensis]MBB6443077.1 multidrug efflux pump subunit AcrB [Phycisphaera mikurensis]BAM05230.1 putative efflux system inner membrane protein [Phycisphaera mikurensis NBRC 102666]
MSLAAFGVRKPVPANLLMVALLIGGLFAGLTLRKQFFPETDPQSAIVRIVYPGATPEEVEETMAIKIEDAVFDLDEVDEVITNLAEGGGSVSVGFVDGTDGDAGVDAVERELAALQDLPPEAEPLTVELIEPQLPVIQMAVFGPVDDSVLKETARSIKDDLAGLPGMGEVRISGVRDYELSVDVQQSALIEQGISLATVANRVRAAMDEVPGGSVRNQTGTSNLRTEGVAETADAVAGIVIASGPDGSVVRLGEVAEVSEGFTDAGVNTRFNGQPGAYVTVYKKGRQDIVRIAEMVRAYVDARRGEPPAELSWLARKIKPHVVAAAELGRDAPQLPGGAEVARFTDLARFVEGRLDLLLRNALMGAVLVFATLALFLNPRTAFWVGVGLVTALGGTLILMAAVDLTLNLLTMFGLIVVLGLLVDDAIVVAENIQATHERGVPPLEAAVVGAGQVGWPVVATVTTSVVAFLPLRFIDGEIGDLLGALPLVVACALIMSLIESLMILPSHMGHSLESADRRAERARRDAVRGGREARPGVVARYAAARDRFIENRVVPAYLGALGGVLHWRYAAVSAAVAALLFAFGMIGSRTVPFVFLPQNDAETLQLDLRLPLGSPMSATRAVVEGIEDAAVAMPDFRSIASVVGESASIDSAVSSGFAAHLAQMFIELEPVETRARTAPQIIEQLRRDIEPHLQVADRFSIEPISGGPGGPDLTLEVRGTDPGRIAAAVAEIKGQLRRFPGVVDVSDDNDAGLPESRFRVRDADAAAAGFTRADVATELRGLTFGLEPHSYAALREDIEVRVRGDAGTRRSQADVENAWIVSPTGRAVPVTEIADVVPGSAYASIKRIDRARTVTVTGYVTTGLSPETVAAELDLSAVREAYPDLEVRFGGRQEQTAEAFASLPYGAGAAAIMIYIILAWLFSKYLQPLAVMAVIPFATVGAVLGHWVMGYDLTFLSIIGLVALAGIVVNDSLIYVEFFNARRAAGEPIHEALLQAGAARLRAIFLTTVTTVLGLTPLILETSFQARFLIPMAISIAGGLIVATVLILGVLPCLLLILNDLTRIGRRAWHGPRVGEA